MTSDRGLTSKNARLRGEAAATNANDKSKAAALKAAALRLNRGHGTLKKEKGEDPPVAKGAPDGAPGRRRRRRYGDRRSQGNLIRDSGTRFREVRFRGCYIGKTRGKPRILRAAC